MVLQKIDIILKNNILFIYSLNNLKNVCFNNFLLDKNKAVS